jgi:hypothetical protein
MPATPGGTLGASILVVTSGDTRAMHDLRRRDGSAPVSFPGAGGAECWWSIHRGQPLPCSGMANASSHPQLRHLDVLSRPPTQTSNHRKENGQRPEIRIVRMVTTSGDDCGHRVLHLARRTPRRRPVRRPSRASGTRRGIRCQAAPAHCPARRCVNHPGS